jgi:LuxR family transcriptional regulator, maltose regulon positive regulatory protein
MSAPAGSGKTFLLRSWIAGTGAAERLAWVPVQGDERDPQRFWLSVRGLRRGVQENTEAVDPATDGNLNNYESLPGGGA